MFERSQISREADERLNEIRKINLELQRMEHEKWLEENDRLPPGYFDPPREHEPFNPPGPISRFFDMLDIISGYLLCWFLYAGLGLLGVFFLWVFIERLFK